MVSAQRAMTAVILFAKAPRKGLVKTRLAAELGEDAALRTYRAVCDQIVRQVSSRYSITIWYTPSDALEEMREWLGPRRYLPQSQGDLGERLANAFDSHFEKGDGPVLAIGADAPGADSNVLAEAEVALEAADIVLGPAFDGGYYLIAMKRPNRGLFRNIPWGTSEVFQRTLDVCAALDLRTTILQPLHDLDTASDMVALGLGT